MSRLVVFAAVLVLPTCAGSGERPLPLNLPQDPYMGLKCTTAPPCDRIGIAIWVGRPMKSVSANVRGHSIALHRSSRNGIGLYRSGRFWEGVFRDDAAAHSAGDLTTRRRVEVLAVGRDGKLRRRVAEIPVSLGYG
jgi:hypothetical protein